MTTAFRGLLYREPQLYDLVFPDADETIGAMVRTAIASTRRWWLDGGRVTFRTASPSSSITVCA